MEHRIIYCVLNTEKWITLVVNYSELLDT